MSTPLKFVEECAMHKTKLICCDKLRINGVLCHEHGCSESWKDKKHECKWCGSDFEPEQQGQVVCDESCSDAYFN
jgi:hypothetical protein